MALFGLVIYDQESKLLVQIQCTSPRTQLTKSQPAVTNFLRQPEPLAPTVNTQCQAHAIYFDFNNASGLLPKALLLHKLTNYGPSAGYGNCLRCYTNSTKPYACYCIVVSSTNVLFPSESQGRNTLEALLFKVFINDVCNVHRFSNYLLSIDDTKILRGIKSCLGTSLFQYDTNSIRGWHRSNFKKLYINL
jgi:hypothetical protein